MKNYLLLTAFFISSTAANSVSAEDLAPPANMEVGNDENQSPPELDCQSSWGQKIMLEDPSLLLEAGQIISFWENATRLTADGSFQVSCPPVSDDSSGIFTREVISKLGSDGGPNAIGQYICENLNEFRMERMPDTPICRLAQSEMQRTGLGSPALGVQPNYDTQRDLIQSIMDNETQAVDGNPAGVAIFVAGIVVGHYTSKFILDKVDQAAADFWDGITVAQEAAQRQAAVDEQYRVMMDARGEADTARENYDNYRDENPRPEDSEPTAEETARKKEFDEKTRQAQHEEDVLVGLASGRCDNAETCDPNNNPDPHLCDDEACFQRKLEDEFGLAARFIGLCERSAGNYLISSTPIPQTVSSSAFERNYESCQISLSEDPCHMAGSQDTCEPVDLDLVPEDLDDIYVTRLFVGGSGCRPDDIQCSIVQKSVLGFPLDPSEEAYRSLKCTGTFPPSNVPDLEDLQVTPLLTFDPKCAIRNGREVCGANAMCLKILSERTYINAANSSGFFAEFPMCEGLSSVDALLQERLRLTVNLGRPLTLDVGDVALFPERDMVQSNIGAVEFPDTPDGFTDDDELIPGELPEVGRANDLNRPSLVTMGATPKLDILLGLGSDDKFRAVMCGPSE